MLLDLFKQFLLSECSVRLVDTILPQKLGLEIVNKICCQIFLFSAGSRVLDMFNLESNCIKSHGNIFLNQAKQLYTDFVRASVPALFFFLFPR